MYCLAALVLCLLPDLHHTLVECLMGTTLAWVLVELALAVQL